MKKIFITLLTVILTVPVFAKKADGPATITVVSYNIRHGKAKDGTNSWEFRAPTSPMMIEDQKPDVLGFQEALDNQIKFITEFTKGYDYIGVGRDDGKQKGEQMGILFNKKAVKLLKWGTYWLSETPDKPSMGWDAACYRTATWALLKDKATGKKFYYVNTHLDHVGWEARKNGLALIMNRVAAMNKEGYPLVITGDFNMTVDRPEFDEIKARMHNAREEAVTTDHHNTYNGWGKARATAIIDYVWYSGFSSCIEYETITKPYMDRTYISDHFPIRATLIF